MKKKFICCIKRIAIVCSLGLIINIFTMEPDPHGLALPGAQQKMYAVPMLPLSNIPVLTTTEQSHTPSQQQELSIRHSVTNSSLGQVIPTMVFQVGPNTLQVPMLNPGVLQALALALQKTIDIQNHLSDHILFEISQKQKEKSQIEARVTLASGFLNLIKNAIQQMTPQPQTFLNSENNAINPISTHKSTIFMAAQ